MGKYRLGGINLSSSVNPEELGKTVEGIIMAFSSLITLIAAYKGVVILPESIQAAASQIGTTVSAVGLAISAIVTTFGLVRKFVVGLSSN